MTFKSTLSQMLPEPLRSKIRNRREFYRKIKPYQTKISHKAWQLFKLKKEHHLILCGFSRSGTTMTYNMMRYAAESKTKTLPKETPAGQTSAIKSEYLITKRPMDILCYEEIERSIGQYKDVKYVVLIRDPRDSLSSKHSLVKDQFFQNLDFQFYINSKNNAITYSNPGLLEVWNAVKRIKRELGEKVLLIRYEDVIENPDKVRCEIEKFSGFKFDKKFQDFYKADIPNELKVQMNGVTPVRKTVEPSWLRKDRLEQVLKSYEVFPELAEMCEDMGYEPLNTVLKKYNIEKINVKKYPKGKIIGFYTNDKTYIEEAKRFEKRLNELNIPHDIQKCPSKKEWVANCAMKAGIIDTARNKYSGPLLYVDVDAYVHENPWSYLRFYENCDMAGYIGANDTLISATLLVNDTPGARKILNIWKEEQEKNPTEWDQDVLKRIILEEEKKPIEEQMFTFYRLPPSLCKVFDKNTLGKFSRPIIEQLQVSREEKWGEKSEAVKKRRARIQQLFK